MKNIIENNKDLKVNAFDLSNNNKINEKEEIISKLKEEIQNIKKKLDEINNKYIKELKEKEKLKKEKEELKNNNKIFSDNLLTKENECLEISKIEKKIDLETDRQISETVQGKEIIKAFENILENGNEFNEYTNDIKVNHFFNEILQIESSQFEIENLKGNIIENGINNENVIENNINIELLEDIKGNKNKIKHKYKYKFNELKREINNFEILTEYDYLLTNFIFKSFSFISHEEYNDIQKLLLLTYKALNLRNRDIENQFDSNENNKSIIFFQICKLFRINDNSLIERFMLSLSKSSQ